MWVNLIEVSTDLLSIIPEDVLFSKKSTIKIYLLESNALNDKSKVYFLPSMPFYNGRTIRTQVLWRKPHSHLVLEKRKRPNTGDFQFSQ